MSKELVSDNNPQVDIHLYDNVKEVLELARSKAYAAVNFAMVEAYWNIGRLIADTIGEDARNEYGKHLMKYLSDRLTADFGKGFDESNLRYMRKFYLTFPIRDALRHELSWTHYRIIMKVENENARQFYLDECVKSTWSTRQLERQINSFFYERLLSSHKAPNAKEVLAAEITAKEPGITPLDVIKDPYVLEFLGLNHNEYHFESDVEKALLTHIQKFLLELGRGFTFEARQKRISFDGEHYYIDLVFYNYVLKCFVLIDLKSGRLTHQDLGQMSMYVNYYTREMMNEGDNPPIGILLCADKSESVVKYTLPEENTQIFASKYKLYLPTEEELRREIETEQKLIAETMGIEAPDDKE
jgi:predicted nuclease of restriction endonuclease-like (RecB) superfamily